MGAAENKTKFDDLVESVRIFKEVTVLNEDGLPVKVDRIEYEQMQDKTQKEIKADVAEILRIIKSPKKINIDNGEGPKEWPADGPLGFNQFMYNGLKETKEEIRKVNDKFTFKYLAKRVIALFAGFAIVFEALRNGGELFKDFWHWIAK
jgi:hypothetical protein